MVCIATPTRLERRDSGLLVVAKVAELDVFIPTPSSCCLFCDEPHMPCEDAVPINAGANFMHRECFFRSMIGSLGHQLGFCGCTGEEDTSEIGISKREAAILAFDFFKRERRGEWLQ